MRACREGSIGYAPAIAVQGSRGRQHRGGRRRYGPLLTGFAALLCGCGEETSAGQENSAVASAPPPVAAAKAMPAGVQPLKAESSGGCPAPTTWGKLARRVSEPIDPIKNKISLDERGVIYWNGEALEPGQLRMYLDFAATIRPSPLLVLEVDPKTPCEHVTAVVATASAALECTKVCSYSVKTWTADKRPAAEAPPEQSTAEDTGSPDNSAAAPN